MTSNYAYQRVSKLKAARALDNHQNLVFVKYMGGKEVDHRVYCPINEIERLKAEVEMYRNLFGKSLDHADAIIELGLNIDEGLA
jgi:hypothetical protein